MLRARTLALAGAGLVAAVIGGAAPSSAATTSGNLIVDAGAESAKPGSSSAVVPLPGWTLASGSQSTAIAYSYGGGYPTSTTPGPAARGENLFYGGYVAKSTASQNISLSAYAGGIAANRATFALSGWLGGFSSQLDNARVTVKWRNASGATIKTVTLGPVTAADRGNVTQLLKRTASGKVPKTAKTARVSLISTRVEGSANDGYADNLRLTITT